MPKLEKFASLSEINLYKLIMEMTTKSCETDIPIKLLKRVLKHCTPALNKIINLYLNTGIFNDGWKSKVVRPLIKSLQKGTSQQTTDQLANHLSSLLLIAAKLVL